VAKLGEKPMKYLKASSPKNGKKIVFKVLMILETIKVRREKKEVREMKII
jgi:hypothetical protein